MGSQWLKAIIENVYNPFWKEVFTIYINTLEIKKLHHKNELLTSPLWFNPQISKNVLFISKWFNNGIKFVCDIVDDHGTVISQQQLEQKFSVNVNFLDYYRVKLSVGDFLRHNSNLKGSFKLPAQPFIPNHIAFFFNNKNAKDIYEQIKFKPNTQMEFQTK